MFACRKKLGIAVAAFFLSKKVYPRGVTGKVLTRRGCTDFSRVVNPFYPMKWSILT